MYPPKFVCKQLLGNKQLKYYTCPLTARTYICVSSKCDTLYTVAEKLAYIYRQSEKEEIIEEYNGIGPLRVPLNISFRHGPAHDKTRQACQVSPLARYNFQIWPRVAATVASWESRGQKIGGIMRGSDSSRPNYLIQNIQMMV